MATRLYLRNVLSGQAGRPTGSATTDSDLGHGGLNRLVCLTLSRSKGSVSTSNQVTCAAHPAGGRDLIRVFLSPPFAAQTLAAGQQFTLAAGFDQCVGGQGGGAFEEVYLRAFAYLWRPGVGYVTTLFSDGSSRSGVNDADPWWQEPFGPTWQVMALPALSADVEVKLRDRMVLETWLERTVETTADAYLYYNGTKDDFNDGDSVSGQNPASFLEFSSDLLLGEDIAMNSANILVSAQDMEVDGVNVGALDGGVTVTYTPTHIEHSVDQRMGLQRVDRVSERMTITANLKEPTLENLRIAWGQPVSALSATLSTLGVGSSTVVTEHTLVLKGKAPGTNKSRTVTCHKAVAIETSAHSYQREGATMVPVTFVLVEDNTKEAGFKYVSITDAAGAYTFA